MARTLRNLLFAVLLIAALSTRCVLACIAQGHSASSSGRTDAHACCHKGKSKTSPVHNEGCEGSSFEVQKPAGEAPSLAALDLSVSITPVFQISVATPAFKVSTYSPSGPVALHDLLLI